MFDIIDNLVKDEIEAIEGYDKAILSFTNDNDMPKEAKEYTLEVLNHIREEELEHIKELRNVVLLIKGAETDLKEDKEIQVLFNLKD